MLDNAKNNCNFLNAIITGYPELTSQQDNHQPSSASAASACLHPTQYLHYRSLIEDFCDMLRRRSQPFLNDPYSVRQLEISRKEIRQTPSG
ncbi:hypothetical protein LAZ67_X000396 [Cordylochernes scorpioides]|uniref:Uncharacterized protein n=1 Tax=Cordylochernes scorpioides TaxID=51811 RepID=A0ABY6LSM4_9ARAC|nr:hypothetical protein LAZ67_X000396 [Cordylochernes scorpioides]